MDPDIGLREYGCARGRPSRELVECYRNPSVFRASITRLEQAALACDDAAISAEIEVLACTSPTRTVAALVPGLRANSPLVVEAHARAAEAVLQRAPKRSWWALDRAARTQDRVGLSLAQVERCAGLEAGRIGALTLASMQRDGWARARAVEILIETRDELGVCALVVRLNDPVPAIAAAADRGLRTKRSAAWLGSWVAALALIEHAHTTIRAGQHELARFTETLVHDQGRAARVALLAGTKATGPGVRGAAIAWLARVFPTCEEAPLALELGLGDPCPQVRRRVAELIASRELPEALSEPLLPRLELDRAPAIRLLGLRWRRRRGDSDALLGACFDANAALRHYARRYHRSTGALVDYRELALGRLGSTQVGTLVGALATLSDVGRAEDRARLEAFAAHSSRAVRAEAQRTLALLGG